MQGVVGELRSEEGVGCMKCVDAYDGVEENVDRRTRKYRWKKKNEEIQ